MKRFLAILSMLTLLSLSAATVRAQDPPAPTDPPKSPLAALAKRLVKAKPVEEGAAAKPEPGKVPLTRFKPTGKRTVIPKIVDQLGQDAEQKKALRQLFDEGMKAYEAEAKKEGFPNDVAAAVTFYVAANWSVYHDGKEPPEEATDTMIAQVQQLFDSPEMKQAKDADKEEFYEWCVAMGTLSMSLFQISKEGKDEKTLESLRASAGEALKNLLKIEPERINITEKGLEILPEKKDE
jgi:hypothetical protein